MYNKIVNPQTGRKVSIYNKLGQNILRKYIAFGGTTTKVSQNSSIPQLCDSNRNLSLDERIKSQYDEAIESIYTCRAKYKQEFSLEATLFCKMHNIREGGGLRNLFKHIVITDIATPTMKRKLSKLSC